MRRSLAWWTLLLGILGSAPLLADGWLPEAASETARAVDRDFTLLLVLGASAVLLLLFALDVLLFVNLRREPAQVGRASGARPVTRALVVLLPALAALGLVTLGIRGQVDAALAPTGALTIEAHGGPAGWSFRYPKDVETNVLHVPAERPVRLTFHAEEEPISVAIPAFRLRRNARPEVVTEAWFLPDRPGEYELLGSGPSLARSAGLRSTVTVHSPADFDDWLASKSDVLLTLPPEEAGRVLLERKGCLVCHSTDGTQRTGPSFLGVLGRTSTFADGTSTVVDADYVRRSVLEPTAQVVKGFQPVMPPFAGQIRDAEIDAIVSYFGTLTETGEAP